MTSSEPRTCPTCGALMTNGMQHEKWHRDLEQRLKKLEDGGTGPLG